MEPEEYISANMAKRDWGTVSVASLGQELVGDLRIGDDEARGEASAESIDSTMYLGPFHQ